MGELTAGIGAVSAGIRGINALSNLFGGSSDAAPSFSPSSVTPQQQALAQYEGEQQLINNAQKFSQGMGHSTGLTMTDAGTILGSNTKLAGFGDVNAMGMNQLNQLAQQQQQLLTQQQSGFGSNAGNFGASTNSTDSGVDTKPDTPSG